MVFIVAHEPIIFAIHLQMKCLYEVWQCDDGRCGALIADRSR